MQKVLIIWWISILYLVMLNSTPAKCQISKELELIIKFNHLNAIDAVETKKNNKLKIPLQPTEFIELSIDFYQYFVSSQDSPSCIFTPSCSKYAEQSLQKFGLFKGILLSSDRLQRCNVFSEKEYWYDFNFQENRYIDSIAK